MGGTTLLVAKSILFYLLLQWCVLLQMSGGKELVWKSCFTTAAPGVRFNQEASGWQFLPLGKVGAASQTCIAECRYGEKQIFSGTVCPAFVLVGTTNVCGGTVVSAKMNGLWLRITHPEGLVSLHLHPYCNVCRNSVRIFKLHGMELARTDLKPPLTPHILYTLTLYCF